MLNRIGIKVKDVNCSEKQLCWALAIVMAIGLVLSGSATAQNNRPGPQRPETQGTPGADRGAATDLPPGDATVVPTATRPNRSRVPREGKVVLAFNETPIEETIPFIVEATGKVVMPVGLQQLKVKRITLINDEPVDRAAALDLLVTALRLNGVGVIETEEVVILDLIENIKIKTPPVLSATDDVMHRTDLGTFIVKIYRLKEAGAETVHEKLMENIPDYATLNFDDNSNQIILYGDVGLAQHYQRLINELDRTYVSVVTRTFRLSYVDAEAVAVQIEELFQPSETGGATGGAGRAQRNQQPRRGAQPATGGAVPATPAGAGTPGPVVELRVSVNVHMNAVTVAAEPAKVEQIARLINEEWDLPRPEETAKVYLLKHTDPLKVRDLLLELLGQGGSSTGGRTGARTGGAAGRANQAAGAGGAGGAGGASVTQAIGDIYRIQAYPDQGKIVVLSKTKETLNYLDSIIEAIDQPSSIGIPELVELKHANAVDLANVLNVLLAEAGTGGGLEEPETGLTGQGFDDMAGGASGGTGGTTGGASGGGTTGGSTAGMIEFPWQRGRPRDDQSEPSPLIGKVRIVPIVRQNALSVVSPPEYRQPIIDLIHQLDRPGRQVMISAVIAQVELTDDLALGLRFSSQEIVPSSPENVLSGSGEFSGTEEGLFGDLFDTSVLDVNVDLNVIIQALAQKTNVRILQEPRVFTADNQEAYFFNGQQVPVLESSNTSDVSGFQQNFEQQDVGVILNVRPRITAQRDVDMEIALELSNIVPGQTVFGNLIFDKRITRTKVIVQNGQTIVLSGILTDTESKITRGIPLLADLPFIGDIFKSHENQKKSTELIAFITPVVVDNPSENDTNFNKQAREHLQDLAKPLKEQVKNRKAIRERIVAPKNEETPIFPEDVFDKESDKKRKVEESSDAPVDVDDLSQEP